MKYVTDTKWENTYINLFILYELYSYCSGSYDVRKPPIGVAYSIHPFTIHIKIKHILYCHEDGILNMC